MRFIKLEIENFQKCKHLEVNFGSGITYIVGANGKGKTTILDAIKWVLFGKDFEDKSRFDINNIFSDGTVAKLPITVSLLMEQNGVEHLLRRSLRGSTTTCSIDDVPYKVTDYSDYVGALTDGENRFKLYSDPLYFFGLHWTEQRSSLMGYFPMPDDKLVLEGMEATDAFIKKLTKLTAEQISASYKAKAKEVKTRQAELGGQLKLLNEYCSHDTESILSVEDERKLVLSEIDSMGTVLENAREKNSKIAALEMEELALKRELESIMRNEENVRQLAKGSILGKTCGLIKKKDELRERLKAIIRTDTVCPTCKRKYDKLTLQAMEDALSEEEHKIKKESSDIDDELRTLEGELESTLNQKEFFTPEEVSRMSHIQKRREEIASFASAMPVDVNAVFAKRLKLVERLDELNRLLARKDLLDENIVKRKMVTEQLWNINAEKEEYELLSGEADRFISKRTEIVVEQLNSAFKSIRIKLFEKLSSGETKECFEVSRDGVPFASLNTASQLEVGLELISFLKDGMGVKSPVLIDNGERYTDVAFKKIGGQVIIAKAIAEKELAIITEEEI